MVNINDIPRRVRINKFTPAEKAIYDAVQVVEEAGAHPLLTDAVALLQQARNKVADYVDGPGKTFEQFLAEALEKGAEVRLVPKPSRHGGPVEFYAHLSDVGGSTVDYAVNGDALLKLDRAAG